MSLRDKPEFYILHEQLDSSADHHSSTASVPTVSTLLQQTRKASQKIWRVCELALIKHYTGEKLISNWCISKATSVNHTRKQKPLIFTASCQSTQPAPTNVTSYRPPIAFLLMSAGSVTGTNINSAILDLEFNFNNLNCAPATSDLPSGRWHAAALKIPCCIGRDKQIETGERQHPPYSHMLLSLPTACWILSPNGFIS